jgi:hypothetical protein
MVSLSPLPRYGAHHTLILHCLADAWLSQTDGDGHWRMIAGHSVQLIIWSQQVIVIHPIFLYLTQAVLASAIELLT